jgi:PAS domain S-box-containing protein
MLSLQARLPVNAGERVADLRAGHFLVFVGGYVLSVVASERLSGSLAFPSPFSFPDAVLLCALLLTRRDRWWVLIAATWPIRLIAGAASGPPLWFLAGGIANDSLKAWLAAWLLERTLRRQVRLDTLRELLVFLGIAGLAVPVLSALAALPLLRALGDPFWSTGYQWFLGNALAQVVVTPMLLYWCTARRPFAGDVRRKELLLVSLGLIVVLPYAFVQAHAAQSPSLLYLPVPFLLWSAVRLRPFGTATAIALVAVVAMLSAVNGKGVFSVGSPGENVLSIQLFLVVVAVSMLSLATLIAENETLTRALTVDVTDRNQAVDALRVNQDRYAVATAAGAVGVWDWNFETGEIYVDTTLKAILGFADAEISTRADEWGSRIHPLDVPVVTAQVQACIEGRTEEYEVEHRMIHKDGSVRWFLSRGSLMRRAEGTPHRMVGTKVDITQRKLAEDGMRENEALLHATHQEMQDLAGRLIAAQEVERARIARNLHDDLSQQLAGLSIALSGFKRRLASLPGAGDLQDDLSSLQQRTIGLAEDIRHLSHDLHPSAIEHAGLVAALAAHCADIQRREIVTVTFIPEGDFAATSADAALCLFRVAQEGLRNVITHAGARHAEVRLRRRGDFAELTISDDGRGFDIARTGASPKGLGLVSIRGAGQAGGGGTVVS